MVPEMAQSLSHLTSPVSQATNQMVSPTTSPLLRRRTSTPQQHQIGLRPGIDKRVRGQQLGRFNGSHAFPP
jgi:hypothetical protein